VAPLEESCFFERYFGILAGAVFLRVPYIDLPGGLLYQHLLAVNYSLLRFLQESHHHQATSKSVNGLTQKGMGLITKSQGSVT
jgi:hypothetical protein